MPSGRRAETLPAVPSTRPGLLHLPGRRDAPRRGRRSREHLRVGEVDRALAPQDPRDVAGDHVGVVGLGVVGGAADVRREHDVGQPSERVVGGEELALEVVEPGAAEVAATAARR